MIAEFEVTNQANYYNRLRPMAAKAADALGTAGFAVVADAGYDSTRDIVGCVRDGFEAHVAGMDFDACVPSDAPGDGITGHKDGRCVYYPERNVALCPMGMAQVLQQVEEARRVPQQQGVQELRLQMHRKDPPPPRGRDGGGGVHQNVRRQKPARPSG